MPIFAARHTGLTGQGYTGAESELGRRLLRWPDVASLTDRFAGEPTTIGRRGNHSDNDFVRWVLIKPVEMDPTSMGGTDGLRTSPADSVVELLNDWPALRLCRADCGFGRAFACGGDQIVHLHGRDQAELYLTWPFIQRMRKSLRECASIRIRPGDGWVGVWLGGDDDVALLVSLVSVAIKANLAALNTSPQRVGPCRLGYSHLAVKFLPQPPPGRGGLTMTPSGNPVEREEHVMRHVADRLIHNLSGSYQPKQITQAIDAIYRRFEDRPVRDFVPVLVERLAREKLTPDPPA
ncbi:MAG: three-helix bundle dimerization domain-containing protein [Spirillospora sp.]